MALDTTNQVLGHMEQVSPSHWVPIAPSSQAEGLLSPILASPRSVEKHVPDTLSPISSERVDVHPAGRRRDRFPPW